MHTAGSSRRLAGKPRSSVKADRNPVRKTRGCGAHQTHAALAAARVLPALLTAFASKRGGLLRPACIEENNWFLAVRCPARTVTSSLPCLLPAAERADDGAIECEDVDDVIRPRRLVAGRGLVGLVPGWSQRGDGVVIIRRRPRRRRRGRRTRRRWPCWRRTLRSAPGRRGC